MRTKKTIKLKDSWKQYVQLGIDAGLPIKDPCNIGDVIIADYLAYADDLAQQAKKERYKKKHLANKPAGKRRPSRKTSKVTKVTKKYIMSERIDGSPVITVKPESKLIEVVQDMNKTVDNAKAQWQDGENPQINEFMQGMMQQRLDNKLKKDLNE